MMKQMDLAGLATEMSSGGSVVVLREQDEPHRLLPIFVGHSEAAAIALAVSGEAPPRPLTHDLMAALVQIFEGHLDAVEVTDLAEGAFVAELAVHGPGGAQRVDTRPSDAIALAVRLGAPLFVAESVLDEAGTLPAEEDDETLDEAAIDEAVDEFRSFLDDVDPAHFAHEEPLGELTEPDETTESRVLTEPSDDTPDGSAERDQAEPDTAEPDDTPDGSAERDQAETDTAEPDDTPDDTSG